MTSVDGGFWEKSDPTHQFSVRLGGVEERWKQEADAEANARCFLRTLAKTRQQLEYLTHLSAVLPSTITNRQSDDSSSNSSSSLSPSPSPTAPPSSEDAPPSSQSSAPVPQIRSSSPSSNSSLETLEELQPKLTKLAEELDSKVTPDTLSRTFDGQIS